MVTRNGFRHGSGYCPGYTSTRPNECPFQKRNREGAGICFRGNADEIRRPEEAARPQLFFAQGYDGIYASGSPSGNDGGGECDRGQQCGQGAEGASVGRAHAE
jgi:hypothetical protein